jgi:two-component system OmpR family sensor kinase
VSLRARLIATLLVLSAVGLLALAAITYFSQRSFEEQRVDDQTSAAGPAVSRALDLETGEDIDGDSRRGARGGLGGGLGAGHGLGGPDPAETNLPPGTYAQRRAPSGRVLGSVTPFSDQTDLPKPDLPSQVTVGRPFTVDAKGSSALRYRVRATPGPGGRLTIVAIPLQGVEDALHRLLLVEGLVIAGVLGLLALLSFVLVRAGLRPLERIGHTADAIAAGELSHRVETANERTEVGRLGLALNSMLDRLDEAFSQREATEGRLRRFLADVSHELRTPLASIRGYAELFRIGAVRKPADTEKAMSRIEEESARMGVLVDDLLTLARLGEVNDRPSEAVDVSALAADAAADARATDPAREIAARDQGEAIVLGDPHQLRQVLANLMRNALVHTPPGTAVEVATRRDGPGLVEIEVRDHGPGLPPGEDPRLLFERFSRPEPGRERGRAGAGLGLAIVAGIVDTHGGTVDAANAPDGGAVFTVRLPLAGQRSGP